MPTIITPRIELNLVSFRGLELRGQPVTAITTASRVPLRRQLNFTGHVPSRAVGLLLHGHIPNLVFPFIEPNKEPLNFTPHEPTIEDTSPQPIKIPTFLNQRRLRSCPPAVAVGQEGDPSSLFLNCHAPLSTPTSPWFRVNKGSIQLTGYAFEREITYDSPIISLDAGSLSIDEKTPVRVVTEVNVRKEPDKLGLDFDEKTPRVFYEDRLAEPDVRELNLTTYEGVLQFSYRGIPGRQTRRLRGKVPGYVEGTNHKITPDPGSLAIDEKTPFSLPGANFLMSVIPLDLASTEPVVIQSVYVYKFPDVLPLSLDERQPTRSVNTFSSPVLRSLSLNEIYAPAVIRSGVQLEGSRTRLISLTVDYDIEIR